MQSMFRDISAAIAICCFAVTVIMWMEILSIHG